MILYPFRQISVYSLATPRCVQSLPIMVKTCPRASDLVIVPSMSDTTIWSAESQTNSRAVQAATPVAEREKVIVLAPGFKSKDFYHR